MHPAHKRASEKDVFSIFFCGCKLLKSLHISFFGGKDSANRTQNKMNLFIFYAEVQPIFAFRRQR